MKHFIYILVLITLFSSCTSVLQTHSEVMNSYNSKEAIISRLGVPHQKRVEGNIEEWIYDYGSYGISRARTTIPNASLNTPTNTFKPIGTTNSGLKFASEGIKFNMPTIATTTIRTDSYSKTVLFRFRDNRLITWETEGVDFETRVKSPKKTAWLIGGTVVGTLLIAKLAEPDDDLYDY